MSTTQKNKLSSFLINFVLAVICLLWTIPTIGVLVSSFRTREDIAVSGWWAIFPHQEWVLLEEISVEGKDTESEMTFAGYSGTFEEFREGVEIADGTRVTWIGNKRLALIEIQEYTWTTRTDFTL